MTPIIRPATREDIDRFSDVPGKPTIKAFCMELDGEIVGVAGVWRRNGRWVGFCDMKEQARPYKMRIARAAIRFMDELREQGIRFVYADSDPNERTSMRWLTSLGFSDDPGSPGYLRWRA